MEQIVLGEGNFLITATPNSLIFRQLLLSSHSIGDVVDFSKEQFSQIVQVNLRNYFELKEFKNLVKNAYFLKCFEFQGVKFDFTQYNRNSVDALLDQVDWIEKFISRSVIC